MALLKKIAFLCCCRSASILGFDVMMSLANINSDKNVNKNYINVNSNDISDGMDENDINIDHLINKNIINIYPKNSIEIKNNNNIINNNNSSQNNIVIINNSTDNSKNDIINYTNAKNVIIDLSNKNISVLMKDNKNNNKTIGYDVIVSNNNQNNNKVYKAEINIDVINKSMLSIKNYNIFPEDFSEENMKTIGHRSKNDANYINEIINNNINFYDNIKNITNSSSYSINSQYIINKNTDEDSSTGYINKMDDNITENNNINNDNINNSINNNNNHINNNINNDNINNNINKNINNNNNHINNSINKNNNNINNNDNRNNINNSNQDIIAANNSNNDDTNIHLLLDYQNDSPRPQQPLLLSTSTSVDEHLAKNHSNFFPYSYDVHSIGHLDICDAETFEAECPVNHVILPHHQPILTRCLEDAFGYVGCYTDVLTLADKHCSGKNGCTIHVPNAEFESTRPCLKDLKSFLRISYDCVPS
ncbi:hypothetical protein HELRODRAFT_159904 [Helobdella robusta]|uniref:SUEL-type lectin domain-containing protein n=1 Tax=Helobdella robusta TaxID=6412 RepID=T1EPJ2_HELRO|nr:hypothetical protein HELRODRAFT_159904 [Helobdella robusta]ESO05828.1 hypothetical protein HELRODRAFT_159904 [Helobdella robusta]